MLRRLPVLAAVLLALTGADAPPPQPPQLHLTLHPVAEQGAVARVEVKLELQAPRLAAGAALLRMPLTIVGIPTAAYTASEIVARDARGVLALRTEDEPARPEGVYRRYLVDRATEGDVLVRYAAHPRVVGPSTNNGPLFDMRAEGAGFEGGGMTFLALPPTETPYRFSLDWNLADMPKGSRGVWSLGEGSVATISPAQQIAFSYYAAGPLRTYPADRTRFGVYWLNEPPFAMEILADRISRLYSTMAAFYAEPKSSYRVFVRQHPYRGVGGTGLARSFMFGYLPAAKPSVDELQDLLAHEIAHNWPAMEGEHGDTAWYSEGTAEYYSLIFSYRAGLLDRQGLLRAINQRANAYYTHPFRGLTNADAAKRFWSDPFVQQVPYGRGFLYLARTDGAIRAASGGKRSLDDVVKEIRRRQLAREPYGIPQWLDLVSAELGREKAEADFEWMKSGKAVTPDRAFSPCYKPVRADRPVFDLGFARRSLNDDAILRDLEPGSSAAEAGLREGDVIVHYTDLKPLVADEKAEMVLTIRRDGGEQVVRYVPRGAPVEAWAFIDDASVPSEQCRF
jgi:hypothetical protein